MSKEKKFLIIGAHPDDPDLMFGGAALQLIPQGHRVKFVSVANGDCGHFSMKPEELAKRRYAEAQASAEIAGLDEYEVLSNGDCMLEATLENRARIVKIIREFQPDVVISHRLCDYHADHRATAQLVQDASFVIMVPLYCPETPIPEEWPVFAFSWDQFLTPTPFQADTAVSIDSVIDKKLAMMNCHVSQFYEWLPWNKGFKDFDVSTMSEDEKRQWLTDNWLCRNARQAEQFMESGLYAESFQMSEYGRQISVEEFLELFKP